MTNEIAAVLRTPMATRSLPRPGNQTAEERSIAKIAGKNLPRQSPDMTGLTRSLQRRAYVDGHAAGFAKAQAETVRQALEAQRKAREFVDASQDQIVTMALATIQRIASTLGPATVVTALLFEALEDIKAARRLRVNVSQSAVKATREMLVRWQSEHPQTEVRVLVDPRLEPFGCEIESELGRIELGLHKQLEATREEPQAVFEVTFEMPMS